jgi:Phage terminase, small subunit
MRSTPRPPGYRAPSDFTAAAKIPASRATRTARERPGEVAWPAMAGEASSYERYCFTVLRDGLSASSGELDALLLAQACRALARAQQAHEALARDGLVVTDTDGVLGPHPAVKIASTFAGVAMRQLAACGIAPVLLDRVPAGLEGLADRERGGRIDESGVLHPADGGPPRYVGKPGKVVPLRRRRK